MELKSKYSLGEECWIMSGNSPTKWRVDGVFFIVSEEDNKIVTNVEYTLARFTSELRHGEEGLYNSKEELLKTL